MSILLSPEKLKHGRELKTKRKIGVVRGNNVGEASSSESSGCLEQTVRMLQIATGQ